MDKHKPLPESLSDWGSRTEVRYICPKCKTSLAYYGHKQKFCHMCGNELDWSTSVKYVSESFRTEMDNIDTKYYNGHSITFEQYTEDRTQLLYKLYKNEFV